MTDIDNLKFKATGLERRLADIWKDIEFLPDHAPLKVRRREEYDRLTAELGAVLRAIYAAQGQGILFEEGV